MIRVSRMALAAALLLGAAGAYRAAAAVPERIALGAAKFEFSATEIRVRKGRAVTLVLKSEDFPHGFSIPDFGVRVDLVPGKTVELTFTPDRAGRFAFLCDNFCGEGHDRMTGMVVVTES